MKLSLLTCLLIPLAVSVRYECPELQYMDSLPKQRCFQASYDQSVNLTFWIAACPGDKLCQYNQRNNFIWPLVGRDVYNLKDIRNFNLWSYCVEAEDWEKGNLLAGRSCDYNLDCRSNLCVGNICKSLEEDAICKADEDCESGLMCKKDTTVDGGTIERNSCQKVKQMYEECTADSDCHVRLVCANFGLCMMPYSLQIGSNSSDGRLCQSGAINSEFKCAQTARLHYIDNDLPYPYFCKPDTGYRCELYDSSDNRVFYQGTTAFQDYADGIDQCQCVNNTRLDNGTYYNIAYCLSLGDANWTSLWTGYSQEISPYLKNCHQADRFNPRAWIDCGESIPSSRVSEWVQLYHTLTFQHFYHDEARYQNLTEAISFYSKSSWDKSLSTMRGTQEKIKLLVEDDWDGAELMAVTVSMMIMTLIL